MRRAGVKLLSCCRYGARPRFCRAPSMDRNYHGIISPSQRARSALADIKAPPLSGTGQNPGAQTNIAFFFVTHVSTRARHQRAALRPPLTELLLFWFIRVYV